MTFKQLLLSVAAVMMAGSMSAQTDVTSTYLTNADFSATTPINNNLKGYGKDMGTATTYYGFQPVDGWTYTVVSGDNSNATYPNSGMGGAVFEYGSSYQMQGNSKTAPAAGPDGAAGQGLGFFSVWGCGGYYYQEVTLPAGNYTINIPVYNQSGTSGTTSYFGFIPTTGDAQTIATPTTTGEWTVLTKSFTLTEETTGKICVGYKSNGSGSAANPMLFIDKVQILYKALADDELAAAKLAEAQGKLQAAITAAAQTMNNTSAAVGDALFAHPQSASDNVRTAITAAEAVLADETDPTKIDDATATLNSAVETYLATINKPLEGQAYTIKNKAAGFYLNLTTGVKITADSYAVQFIANGTGWTIASAIDAAVTAGMAGGNSWTMSNAVATAWTITPTISEEEVIYTFRGPNGLIGTDAITDGAECYGDKNAAKNGEWYIEAIDAIGMAKVELTAAISEATTYSANFSAGEGPLYRPVTALTALQSAISDAQSVNEDEEATLAQIEAAKTEIEEALATYKAAEVTPLDLTKKYTFINVSEGFGYKGNALTFMSASNADLAANTTKMGYTELPGSVYPQAVTLTAVDDVENGFTFSYTRADGNIIYLTTGLTGGYGGNSNQIRPTTDATKALTIQLRPTANVGVYKLFNTEANNTIGSNGDSGFYTVNSYNDFEMVEAVENEYELTITAENKYATVIVPFDAALPAGVKAYTADDVNDNEVVLTEATALKANTPYVVYAEEGATATLCGLGSAYTDATYTAGLLTGAYAAFNAPVGSYVLQNQGGDVKFYVVEGEAKAVAAGHAYLTAPTAGEVKALGFSAITTAIQNLEVAKAAQNGAIFNLNGQRVNTLQKGINIVGGKKVLVK